MPDWAGKMASGKIISELKLVIGGLNHLIEKIDRFGLIDCYVGSGHFRSIDVRNKCI